MVRGLERAAWIVGVLGCGPTAAGDDGDGITGTASTGSSTQVTTQTTSASTSVPSTTQDPSTDATADPSTSTSASGVTETSSSADTVGYIQSPDGGCVSLSCDVWAQDCPPGERCVPWDPSGQGMPVPCGCACARCSAIDADPKPPGAPCIAEDGPWSGIDDCELGAYCWNVDARTHEGVCVAHCIGSQAQPACEDPALSCFELDPVTACVPACDPLAPACDSGFTCVVAAGATQASLCVAQDLGVATGIGSECTPEIGCGSGFACVDGPMLDNCVSASCCAALCDLAAPTCVAENPECVQVVDAPDGVGACVAA